jgi:hypothetical protein
MAFARSPSPMEVTMTMNVATPADRALRGETAGQSDGPAVQPTLRLRDGYDGTSPELRDDVTKLQTLLREHGLDVEPDGFFGPGTEGAVKAFQRSHHLDDDGIVGPRTWSMLSGEPQPTVASTEFPTTFAAAHAGLGKELVASVRYRAFAEVAAARYDVPLCVIAGIASRESGWGLMLKPQGPGGTGDSAPRAPRPPMRPGSRPSDGGFGRGLMQIDFDSHPFARMGQWADPAANILYGASVLAQNRALLGKALAGVNGILLLSASLSAYNCGAGNVLKALQKNLDVDYFTSGRDYGRDTLNRAGWFRQKGWT